MSFPLNHHSIASSSSSTMEFLFFTVLLLAAQLVHADDNALALKKHVAFFDRNHDGIIHISETVEGFKALGFGTAKSTASALLIHTALSSKTRPGGSFHPKFPIVIENIKLAKHTSDSDCYDTEGRFVPEKFEEVFAKHAHTNATALTSRELDEFVKANREPHDYKGWAAAKAEWSQLFQIGKDSNNLLPKETVRKVFNGSLFIEIAHKRYRNVNGDVALLPASTRRLQNFNDDNRADFGLSGSAPCYCKNHGPCVLINKYGW